MDPGSGRELCLVASRISYEERRLLEACAAAGVPVTHLDPRRWAFRLGRGGYLEPVGDRALDPARLVFLMREVSHSRSAYLAAIVERMGGVAVNSSETIRLAGDKLLASLELGGAGLPVPRTVLAFDEGVGVGETDVLGYPAVVKPTVGSWGRLIARLDTAASARAIFEHRFHFQNPMHKTLYLQEFVGGGGHDVRVIVVGAEVIGAIERRGADWRSNVARAATAHPLELPEEARALAKRAAAAVHGEVVAVDLLTDGDGKFLVNEVNHNVEFRGFESATAIDAAGAIVRHLAERYVR